ncbi:MAG: hypothetical protein ACE5J5_06960, partial [Candidatus Hydrothermarchaeales archaeon]
LLESVSKNYKSYRKLLEKALEDGLIADEEEAELRNIRKAMWEDALEIACKGGSISEDAQAILSVVKKSVGLDDYTIKVIEEKIKSKYLMS